MLDVSDAVRAEIGEAEADRLLAGENDPGDYDCTSCRARGNTQQERTSTVLFVGEETAVLAFAHAVCIPSQVVTVTEDQLQGAVRSLAADVPAPATGRSAPPAAPAAPAPAVPPPTAPSRAATPEGGARQAVLGVTCGQVLIDDAAHPALVVEPTGPIARPGSDGPGDDFLPLLIEQGFMPVTEVGRLPAPVVGWSVLVAMGQLHAVFQPPATPGGQPVAWWQAHQPLAVTEGWRTAAAKSHTVVVYAAPAGSIGQQPREDLLREALEKAAAGGVLVAGTMPLTGT
ncbi:MULTISPECIES: hypothetical protein [Streptomyces]|uniref:hypothetical protein n=1 Tax=Streptomyces TaxID=1883 RepID=UPI00161C7580|nr:MULTISPECIES: hypothetical protein [unclassified Streptomyces]MBQ0868576.1 hypothetical protein [Streptomyces sp. RK75]MBQ1125116.1 hypothetical protein [Streptomyces sp. B15]